MIQQISPALLALGKKDTKEYENRYEIIHRWEASYSNEIWQADHTLLDICLIDEHGKPARPWLTIIIDDYSRAIAGYFLYFQAPSALQTALALHQAIWRKTDPRWRICGIPEILYTDHGSDFISQHLEQVCAGLKIQTFFSTGGKPRGRGKIERFFETVNQLLLCSLPGYTKTGSSGPIVPTLTLQELDALFLPFLLDTYHTKDHGTTELPPQTMWEANGFLPGLPESLEQLDLLLLTVAQPRKVQPDGIRFQGLRYFSINLAPYVREDVIIRYDPRDLAQIRVYHRNKFLCVATCQEIAGQTISLKDIIRARRRNKRNLNEEIKKHSSVVDKLLNNQQETMDTFCDPEKIETILKSETETKKPYIKKYHND